MPADPKARTLEGLSKDSSKDSGSPEFHHQRMDDFAAVTEQWLAAADRPQTDGGPAQAGHGRNRNPPGDLRLR